MNLFRYPWNLVYFIGFVVYVGIRHVFMKRTKRIETVVRQVDSLEKLLMAIVFVGSLLLPVIYLFTPLLSFADYQQPSFVPYIGSVFIIVALWFFWKSHSDLGVNWSMTLELRKEHQLINYGIYRSIRHPMYASIWLFGIAQALLLPNWIAGFSAVVTFAPMYFLRTPREERMMQNAFGEQYLEYMRLTGRVLPRLK